MEARLIILLCGVKSRYPAWTITFDLERLKKQAEEEAGQQGGTPPTLTRAI
jgi:hypothetical protein